MKNIKSIATNNAVVLVVAFALAVLVGFGVNYSISKHKQLSTQSSCTGVCVSLYDDYVSPDTVTVKVGTYVQFNSADGKTHNLALGKGGGEHEHSGKFYSGEFKSDEGWRVQFNDEGTYFFHDHLNPKINVLVVVYSPGKDYKVQ